MDSSEIARQFSRLMAPMGRRILLMAARIVLTGATDKAPVQVVQFKGLADEVKQNVEYLQAFGFSSVPPAGARGLAIFPGGDRSHGVVVVLDARDQQPHALQGGESMLWSLFGSFVHLREDGILHIKAPTGVLIEAPDVELRGTRVRIHGEEKTIVEAAGHGEVWKPDRKDTYTIGAVAGSSNPINPPEIP